MDTTQPIPQPGLAILPQYLSSKPQTIILKGSVLSGPMIASTPDDKPLLRIESESFSLSHRRTVFDELTNTKLFQVRKQSRKEYYAEISENGPRLFEVRIDSRMFHRDEVTITFANQADSARPVVKVDMSPPGTTSGGIFMWNGQIVGTMEKDGLSLRGRHELVIAPGLDPVLIVGVMVAWIDRESSRRNTNAAAGSAGGVAAVTC